MDAKELDSMLGKTRSSIGTQYWGKSFYHIKDLL
ncbi:hypothetical protein B0F89_12834 [Malaciobacter marinus]|uniref:Uncharacterized protein n=1 Tax=Malaciobacter marinus TaxID=505249 RepID=A0AB36ZTS9_9BACT|nr:hypothetical protein B0F89_12834 [Malaciobacter marinus]